MGYRFMEQSKCIEYVGKNIVGLGYLQIQINGKRFYAHRLVAMLFHGLEIQDTTTVVLHSCDNPKCINPEHLRLGTARDNVHDCIAKGRFVKRTRKDTQGEKNPKAKLTWDQVREIRQVYSEGNSTYGQLAGIYGMSVSMISKIVRKHYWIE